MSISLPYFFSSKQYNYNAQETCCLKWNSNIAIKSSLFTKAERINLVITDRNYYIIKATGMENGQGSKISPYAI